MSREILDNDLIEKSILEFIDMDPNRKFSKEECAGYVRYTITDSNGDGYLDVFINEGKTTFRCQGRNKDIAKECSAFIIDNANNFEYLNSLGFEISEFGINTVIIKAHPTWLITGYEEEQIRRIIDIVIADKKKFDPIKFNDHIDMKTADGSITIGWAPSQVDMLAEDWQTFK